MAKKIKAKKQQKKEESRLFLTIILIAVGFIVIGGAAALIFGTGGSSSTAASGHDAQIQADLNQLGSSWQSLGVASWLYRPGDIMVYLDANKWQSMSLAEKQKMVNKVGKEISNLLVDKHGQDLKQVYIMFHLAQNQDIMVATYSGPSGGQIQQ